MKHTHSFHGKSFSVRYLLHQYRAQGETKGKCYQNLTWEPKCLLGLLTKSQYIGKVIQRSIASPKPAASPKSLTPSWITSCLQMHRYAPPRLIFHTLYTCAIPKTTRHLQLGQSHVQLAGKHRKEQLQFQMRVLPTFLLEENGISQWTPY